MRVSLLAIKDKEDITATETNGDVSEKLDDGWPESVEEQGLLLLVWTHHITKQYNDDVL